ncbi:hypothetical protein LPY66_18265 [Dehalobacter sp. DCM]|uniref:hypothetical protein n=1 Tax=Dehalobacter sp. DCM TaxID=2907827 RepID=UPI0030821E5D|nr:hypothetical protein LPY66_18265 [Dehalobacter sp. DCM]
MNKEELDAIRDRCEKATPGPWKWIINGNTVQSHAITTDTGECGIQEKICASISPKTRNAEFIAHARTDIPLLLAGIDKLQQGNDYAKELLDKQILRNEGLSKRVSTMKGEIDRLTAERDAALKAMKELAKENGSCLGCVNFETDITARMYASKVIRNAKDILIVGNGEE